MITLQPGKRTGSVTIPRSKSHEHRLLVADFLAGDYSRLPPAEGDSEDILATKRCLETLKDAGQLAILDCGESGSTLRFLLPVVGALGVSGYFRMEGRLPERPMKAYEDLLCAHGMRIERDGSWLRFGGQLQSGEYRLPGDVSSQYFSGLLMALPMISGESTVIAEGKLESADYIRLTDAAQQGDAADDRCRDNIIRVA